MDDWKVGNEVFCFCLFSPCYFSPIFRPVVNSSKGVNEERKLVEVNERFFHDVIECFPQLLLLPLQGWLPLLGKGKCSAFYLYTTPPILLPCIDFTRASGTRNGGFDDMHFLSII